MYSQVGRYSSTSNNLDQSEHDERAQFFNEFNFLYALLTVPARFWNADYRENDLAEHMAAYGIPNAFSRRNLPISYKSAAKYCNTYTPLLFYNCWATLVSEFQKLYDDTTHHHKRSVKRTIDISPSIETERVLGWVTNIEISHWDPNFISIEIELSATKRIKTILAWIRQERLKIRNANNYHRSDGEIDEERFKAFEHDPFHFCYSIVLAMIAPPVGCEHMRNTVGVCREESFEPTDEIGQKMAISYGTACKEVNPLKHIYRYTFLVANNEKNMQLFRKKSLKIVQGVAHIRSIIRCLRSMRKIAKDPDFVPTLLNPSISISALNFERTARTFPRGFYDPDRFNERQRAAIIGALNLVRESSSSSSCKKSHGRIAMIQGPPGTGKTQTLTGIVLNILFNCGPSGGPGRAILICAPSNGAIDEVAIRLIAERQKFEQNSGIPLCMIRLGSIDKIRPEVLRYTLDAQINSLLSSSSSSWKKKNNYSKIRDKLINSAHVLLSTLGSSQSGILPQSNYVIKGFRCVIVDEASQCIEPELMMPLTEYGKLRNCKLIMIGDHQQLPATVISTVAKQIQFGRSLFERLYHRYAELIADANQDDANHRNPIPITNPMLMLCEQFRMRKEICAFPSKQFYDNCLRTPAGTGINAAVRLRPYAMFNITNSVESTINASKANPIEAQFVFELVLAILTRLDGSNFATNNLRKKQISVSISIITYYRSQKAELLNIFKQFYRNNLPKFIEINTVDSFQGRESDIVIVSCVRSLKRIVSGGVYARGGGIGFVSSAKRMNVAITRAKSSLFVCMHGASFRREPNWRQMIEDAKRDRNWIDIVFDRKPSSGDQAAIVEQSYLRTIIEMIKDDDNDNRHVCEINNSDDEANVTDRAQSLIEINIIPTNNNNNNNNNTRVKEVVTIEDSMAAANEDDDKESFKSAKSRCLSFEDEDNSPKNSISPSSSSSPVTSKQQSFPISEQKQKTEQNSSKSIEWIRFKAAKLIS